jgi:hypothetical protein
MIFNYCLYGTIYNESNEINTSELTLKGTYYNNKLDFSVNKSYNVVNNYQINLGDSSLLGINSRIFQGDIILLEFFDENNIKIYSNIIEIINNNNIQQYDVSLGFIDNSDVANFNVSENIVKLAIQNVNENSLNLYSFWSVLNVDTGEIMQEKNESFSFTPNSSGKYRITQTALNVNNSLSVKEYEYNAIVSGTSITRSTKCKSINDAIKILIIDETGNSPTIDIFKDNTLLESGTMALEGGNLYSYNYIFPSEGYYLFSVRSDDETFLVDYKVNQNALKFYYSEESLNDNLIINYDYYYINDVNTILDSGTLISIGNGIYSSELLNVKYGDYLIIINGQEYVTSFEECIIMDSDISTCNSKSSEEIYWIFPNIIGD